jgi:hypothetical protein
LCHGHQCDKSYETPILGFSSRNEIGKAASLAALPRAARLVALGSMGVGDKLLNGGCHQAPEFGLVSAFKVLQKRLAWGFTRQNFDVDGNWLLEHLANII